MFKLLIKPFQRGLDLLLVFEIFDYLVLSSFDARFDLWLEVVFDEGAANVRIVLKIVKCLRIH